MKESWVVVVVVGELVVVVVMGGDGGGCGSDGWLWCWEMVDGGIGGRMVDGVVVVVVMVVVMIG